MRKLRKWPATLAAIAVIGAVFAYPAFFVPVAVFVAILALAARALPTDGAVYLPEPDGTFTVYGTTGNVLSFNHTEHSARAECERLNR